MALLSIPSQLVLNQSEKRSMAEAIHIKREQTLHIQIVDYRSTYIAAHHLARAKTLPSPNHSHHTYPHTTPISIQFILIQYFKISGYTRSIYTHHHHVIIICISNFLESCTVSSTEENPPVKTFQFIISYSATRKLTNIPYYTIL